MPLIDVPGGSAPAGGILVPGTLAIVPQLASGMTEAIACSLYGLHRTTHYYTSTSLLSTTQGFQSSAGAGGSGVTSDGADDDGCAQISTGTDGNGSNITTADVSWAAAAGQIQRRYGFYWWSRFKLPSTMTSLTNRVFGIQAISSQVADDMGAATPEMSNSASTSSQATTQTFICIRWRQGTNGANWVVRVGNGANAEDALDTGIATATNTLYHFELWNIPGGNLFFRGNSGLTQTVSSSLLPAQDAATLNGTTGLNARNNAAVTGNGAIAFRIYSWGLYAA